MSTLVANATNCLILETDNCSSIRYSHKFDEIVLRNEIVSSIQTGLISWIIEPFATSLCTDDEIFVNFLYTGFFDNKKVMLYYFPLGSCCKRCPFARY